MSMVPALYGVVGHPVSHSLSPTIHNGWIADYGLQANYAAYDIRPDNFSNAVGVLADADVRGLNVTLPFKSEALDLAITAGESAQAIGAANTLSRTNGGDWHADNTDADGFAADLMSHLGSGNTVEGATVLLLGAGGASRAVVHALLKRKVERILVLNRTRSRADDLAASFGTDQVVSGGLDDTVNYITEADIVVNGIAIGQDFQFSAVGKGRLYYDLSYGPKTQERLEAVIAQNWKAVDGLGMLIGQAAKSFELWFGISPDLERARQRCKEVLAT